MKRILELRAAEGGDDSKLFVNDLATAYEKTFQKLHWNSVRLIQRPGLLTIEITGKNLSKLNNETGNHILNRVPPTEKNGRVHTSVITVAVVNEVDMSAGDDDYYKRDNSDYRFEIFKSTGAGGQSRNKTSSGVKCIHIPTGIKQERTAKCQHSNRKNALAAVNKLLDEHILNDVTQQVQTQRTNNIGSGERGTKMRIYKFQQGLVIDNKSGKRITIKQFFKGYVNKLWK